jgi:hypothetical protein
MSQLTFNGGSGGGGPFNADFKIEPIGTGTDGTGTDVQAGSANTKGTASTLGTTTNSWKGFTLELQVASVNARFLVDVSVDGGSTWVIPNLYAGPSTSASTVVYEIPLNVASGSSIKVRCQSSTGSAHIRAYVDGWVSQGSGDPPGFTIADVLVAADTTNTRASTTDVSMDATGTTWTELVTSLAHDYGALLVSVSENATVPSTQGGRVRLATGAAASEVFQWGRAISLNSTSGSGSGRFTGLSRRSYTTGQRVSGNVWVATPGTEKLAVGLIGFR